MHARRCAAAMLVSAASCGVPASDEDTAAMPPAPRTMIEVEALGPLNVRLTPPPSSLPAAGELSLLPPNDGADALRARGWLRFGAVGVGTGGDWPLRGSMRPVFGLRADLSQRASVIYERISPAVPPPGLDAGLPGERLALEFKSSDPASLYRGLVRLQLSSSSSLLLRPRGGGMMMSWRANF